MFTKNIFLPIFHQRSYYLAGDCLS